MKRKHQLFVRGRQSTWAFQVEVDSAALEEMRADGVEIEGEVGGSVPLWLPAGLTRAWVFVQDVFNFRNPFAGARG